MLACCAGIFLADLLGLTGGSLGFAALCASGMASLAGMWTGTREQPSSIFSGMQIWIELYVFIATHGQAACQPLVGVCQSCGGFVHLLKPKLQDAGAEVMGGALMLLFFVTIGAAAGSPRSLLGCGWLAMFMVVQLAVHLGIVLGVGKAAGLPMQVRTLATAVRKVYKQPVAHLETSGGVLQCTVNRSCDLWTVCPLQRGFAALCKGALWLQALLTASNAAIGGPGTAAAMAQGRGWASQVTPALLTGSLGYAVGTPIGLAVGALLQQL